MSGSGDSGNRAAMTGTRVAVLGYGDQARAHARGLREAGNDVHVAVRPGGMSWLRCVEDGFRPQTVVDAVREAEVVAMLVPDAEQATLYATQVAPNLKTGALVVFGRGGPIMTGGFEPARTVDVVLVKTRDGACLVAVHQDETGAACARAIKYARAACGEEARSVATTTFEREMSIDLSEEAAHTGGMDEIVAACDRALSRAGHEPDEASLAYYERLKETVTESRTQRVAAVRPSQSSPSLSMRAEAGSPTVAMTTKQRGVA